MRHYLMSVNDEDGFIVYTSVWAASATIAKLFYARKKGVSAVECHEIAPNLVPEDDIEVFRCNLRVA